MMILGVREILMTRSHIKSEFRINQTVISAGKNNPLKFSVSTEHVIESMVKPTSKGYLDADDAATEALNDIKAHEVAMMTGMEAALKGVLARLEPSALAKVIEADSGFRAVLTNKKARYWDTFEAKYQEISDQAENDFHDLFSKEFARAYQDQLERLK
jgi:type VI secretion system FHA domain protein